MTQPFPCRLLLLVLLLGTSAAQADQQAADTSAPTLLPSTEKLVRSYLMNRNILIGVGYSEAWFNAAKPGDSVAVTNGGGPVLVAAINSATTPLLQLPLRDQGSISLGYDFTAAVSMFSPHKQALGSSNSVEDVGTHVDGSFVAAAPRLTLDMGPLYADRPVGWKASVGAGGALVHYQGNAIFPGSGKRRLDSGTAKPAAYVEARWIMSYGHWDVLINGQFFALRDQGYRDSWNVVGVGLAYEFGY